MAIQTYYRLTCDRCGEAQEVFTEIDNPNNLQILIDANQKGNLPWETASSHLLCGICADSYRKLKRRHAEEEKEFFLMT